MIKLAILIPTLFNRTQYLERLLTVLNNQIKGRSDVMILQECDNGEMTTGEKRNRLMNVAVEKKVKYICFIDDDDLPSPDYIEKVIAGIETDADCLSLTGMLYVSDRPSKMFIHSLEFTSWGEVPQYYYRCPNHLNVVKLDKVKDIPYENKYFGEDGTWSMAVQNAGVLKTEYNVPGVIYHYFTGAKDLFKELRLAGYK